MKLSVCFITLNEEKVIEKILSDVKKFADEIIIVDTGSVDSTIVKCLKFTDKIYKFKWIYDFSSARNFAFSKASGDYLMWLDADDRISDENVKKILKIKEEKVPKDIYFMKYLCGFDENGKHAFEFYRERIIRNCPLAKFKGFVHEAVIPFGEIEYSSVEIRHEKPNGEYSKRNLNIYKKNLGKEDFSARDTYYFAKEYYYHGYYFSALKTLKKFLNMSGKYLPDVKDAYITLYECSKILKEFNAKKYLLKCVEECGIDSEVLCLLGDEKLNDNNLSSAINLYSSALNLNEQNAIGFLKKDYYYIYPLLQLVYAYYKLGDFKNSYKYHLICKENYGDDRRVLHNERFFSANNK